MGKKIKRVVGASFSGGWWKAKVRPDNLSTKNGQRLLLLYEVSSNGRPYRAIAESCINSDLLKEYDAANNELYIVINADDYVKGNTEVCFRLYRECCKDSCL